MYNMLSLLQERYPDQSKTWSFKTHSPTTPDNYTSFNFRGETRRVPTAAEVSWRHDLQTLRAQYAVSATLHGFAIDDQKLTTPDYDVFGFETRFDDDVVTRRNLILGRLVEIEVKKELIPVHFQDIIPLTKLIFVNADVFMYQKIAAIEASSKG